MPDTVKGVEIDPVREKLMEIFQHDDCPIFMVLGELEQLVDYLIANGVIVQHAPETDAGRWILVTEKQPNLIPCSVGTGYSEAVNVLTEGKKVLTAIWDGTEFIADADFWDAEGEKITHWTPVLLPLADPPEENDYAETIH